MASRINRQIGEQIQGHIDRVGWAVTGVMPSHNDPPQTTSFAYTVGLTEKNLPELLMAGLPARTMQQLLNTAAAHLTSDGSPPFRHGEHVTGIVASYPLIVVQGPVPQRIGDALTTHGSLADTLFPGVAVARYGRDALRLQQLVWPDREGHFPWDGAYVIEAWVQPTLAVPPVTTTPELRHVP